MPDVNVISKDEAKPIVKPAPPQRPLEQGRLKLEQHARQSWLVTLGDETPREAIFRPEFWLHVAAKMHPLDKLSVTDDAGTYYMECLVVGVDRTMAHVQKVFETSLVTPPQPDDADLRVVWAGPHRRWEVQRGGKSLGSGHATRAAAEIAMTGFAGGRS